LGGERITVRAGEVTAFWAAVPHQIVDFNDVTFYYVVTVPLNWVLGWGLPETFLCELLEGRPVFDGKSSAVRDRQLFEQWYNDLAADPKGLREIVLLEIKARLWRLGRTVSMQDGAADQHLGGSLVQGPATVGNVESMACFVARNYTSKILLEDIARSVGLHPDYAATLFRKTLGITLITLVTRHRIAHAQRLLVTTNERILQIASDSGFESISRFNKAFKDLTGLTPRQYRQECGPNLATSSL
jgi:AraC-like DNA-binding protein